MKSLALGLLAAASLPATATSSPAGEVQVRIFGEVTTNLSSSGPYLNVTKGSHLTLTFRVQTPGAPIVPGHETDYAIRLSTLTVQVPGAGNETLVLPNTMTVRDDVSGQDRFILGPCGSGPGFALHLDVRTPDTFIATTDLESLTGMYDILNNAVFNLGYLSDPSGTFLEILWLTTTIAPPLAGPTFCDPNEPNATGFPTILAAATTGPGGTLHLEGESGPPNQFGYFLVGATTSEPGTPISQGRLCLALGGGHVVGRYASAGFASLGRFDLAGILQNVSGTSAVGSGFDVPASLPLPGSPTIQPGETWHFQLWHREPGGLANFSNGISVTF